MRASASQYKLRMMRTLLFTAMSAAVLAGQTDPARPAAEPPKPARDPGLYVTIVTNHGSWSYSTSPTASDSLHRHANSSGAYPLCFLKSVKYVAFALELRADSSAEVL